MTEQERFEQEYQTTILPALEIMEGIETEMPLSEGELMRMVCVSYNNLRQAMDMAQKFQDNTTMDRHYHCHGAFMYWQAKYAAFKTGGSQVYEQIKKERIAQDCRFGGPWHDDTHGPIDWLNFIRKHTEQAEVGCPTDYRYQLTRIAALAVAAAESYDRQVKP